jgi:hypothetical protein
VSTRKRGRRRRRKKKKRIKKKGREQRTAMREAKLTSTARKSCSIFFRSWSETLGLLVVSCWRGDAIGMEAA